jgi:hypothetical protein
MAKKLLLAAAAIAIVQLSLYAQSISLSGYVRDAKTRLGIAGATVTLNTHRQFLCVTDTAGHYVITGNVGINETSIGRSSFASPRFINNTLSFSVPATGTVVRVDVFNLAGRFIATLFDKPCNAGDFSLRPSLVGFSCQVYVLKVQIGTVTSLLAMHVQNPGKNSTISFHDKSRLSNAKQGLFKSTASVDMLVAAAPGYDTGYQKISSYSGAADFLLDKILMVLDSLNYSQHGNLIIISQAYQISRYSYCSGNSLSEYFDTIQPGYDTTEFANSGDTLWLIMPPETTTSTYTAYQTELVFLRNGTGTGLVGKWKVCGIDYRILSGSFSTGERQSLDSSNAGMVAMYDSMGVEYVFTGTMIKFGVHGGYNYAGEFITSWNSSYDPMSADSAVYDISVVPVSNTKVKLFGRKSGELVTIVWTSGSAPDQTYTSSNPAHAPYTYFQNPTACPDNPEPDWWTDFLSANQKTGLLKRLAKTEYAPAAPVSTVLPAKKIWYKAFRIIH